MITEPKSVNMSLELEESSINNLSGQISGSIAMFDDSSLLIANNQSCPDVLFLEANST